MDAQETRIYTTAIITAIVVSGITLYFIISIIRQQRKIIDLNKQITLAEITAIENDRARIAYDLHDELGPLLSSIKLNISILEINDPDEKIQIDKINVNIDKAINRIREISYNLTPIVLTGSGLATTLREFVNNIDRDILDISLIFPDAVTISEQTSVNIYRMVQEIIHNTIKHAKASQLDIVFKKENNKIIISFRDNGIGFEQKEIINNNGLGLKSLHSRVHLMNGKMYLDSKREAGTEYIFEIPC